MVASRSSGPTLRRIANRYDLDQHWSITIPTGFFFVTVGIFGSWTNLEGERGRVPKLDGAVGVAGDDDLGVAGRHGAPLAARDGPLAVAEAGRPVRLGADRVEGRNEVARTVGQVETTRNGRLVQVHRVRVLETGQARRQQVDDDQIVLQQHQDGRRILRLAGPRPLRQCHEVDDVVLHLQHGRVAAVHHRDRRRPSGTLLR